MGNAQHRRFSPKSLPFTHCFTCKYTHNFRGKLCCFPLLVGKLRKTFGLWRQKDVQELVVDLAKSLRICDLFTFSTPPFNAEIRTEKKLLGNTRFSAALKIANFGGFCSVVGRFFETSACL